MIRDRAKEQVRRASVQNTVAVVGLGMRQEQAWIRSIDQCASESGEREPTAKEQKVADDQSDQGRQWVDATRVLGSKTEPELLCTSKHGETHLAHTENKQPGTCEM
jgi:hypothetical protein